jgi:hypothetical protein
MDDCSLLPTNFLCTSINSLRVAEDAITTLLLLFIFGILLIIIYKIVKEGPLVKRIWMLIMGLMPFFIWKLLGTFRRIFIENSSPLYTQLNEIGEVLESVSALFILASLIYFFILIKNMTLKSREK